jgi:hypothetical protein
MSKLKFNYTKAKPKKKHRVIRLITPDHSIYPELLKAREEQLQKQIEERQQKQIKEKEIK